MPKKNNDKLMIFSLLQRLNTLEKVAVPFVWTKVDRDILIAVGAAGEQGEPLGLKQLTLREIASAATVRRRIAHLTEKGYIDKVVHRNDRRAVVYVVSPPIAKYMERLGMELLASARMESPEEPRGR